MKKDEIIQTTLRAMRQDRGLFPNDDSGDDDWDDQLDLVIATLTERLPDLDFRTCADFGELGVKCCPTCHTFTPHWEMYIEDLPDGNKAWLCCSIRSALHGPKTLEELEELIELEAALGGGKRNRTADEPETR
ncbi:MAG: hypothetical protein WCE63_03515 [Acidobacteriaceae bacterium]